MWCVVWLWLLLVLFGFVVFVFVFGRFWLVVVFVCGVVSSLFGAFCFGVVFGGCGAPFCGFAVLVSGGLCGFLPLILICFYFEI